MLASFIKKHKKFIPGLVSQLGVIGHIKTNGSEYSEVCPKCCGYPKDGAAVLAREAGVVCKGRMAFSRS